MQTAHKLHKNLTDRILNIKGHEIRPELSIGGAIYPRDGERIEDLIKVADDHVYQAKDGKTSEEKVIFAKD